MMVSLLQCVFKRLFSLYNIYTLCLTEGDERPPTARTAASFEQRRQSVTRSAELAVGGGHVLNTVSKMLFNLKAHLTRAASTPASAPEPPPPSSPSGNRLIVTQVDPGHHTQSHQSLTEDLKRYERDNRHLQDELNKKDQMLGLLTEGLREVEFNQQRWLVSIQFFFVVLTK